MAYIPPAKVLSALPTTVTVAATWTTVDSTGFVGSPYRWNVVFNITPQPTSYILSQTPYSYTGLDVAVGDWFSNATGGFAWQIISISAQASTQVTCIVEDINRFNTLSDAGNQGDGTPATNSPGFIFQLSTSGMPVLSPVIENVITSQWQSDIQGRFLLTSPLAPIATSGSASDITTGIMSSAQIPVATSTTIGGVKPDGVQITNNAGVITVGTIPVTSVTGALTTTAIPAGISGQVLLASGTAGRSNALAFTGASSGYVLTYNGTTVAWSAPTSSGGATIPAGASGQILTATGTSGVAAALSFSGASSGYILTYNGTTATWAPPPTGSATIPAGANQVLTGTSTAGTAALVSTSGASTGYLLTYNAGAAPTWSAPPSGTSVIPAGVSGQLLTASGTLGTAAVLSNGSATLGAVLTYNGTSTVAWTTPSITGSVLTYNGSATVWASPVTGTITPTTVQVAGTSDMIVLNSGTTQITAANFMSSLGVIQSTTTGTGTVDISTIADGKRLVFTAAGTITNTTTTILDGYGIQVINAGSGIVTFGTGITSTATIAAGHMALVNAVSVSGSVVVYAFVI